MLESAESSLSTVYHGSRVYQFASHVVPTKCGKQAGLLFRLGVLQNKQGMQQPGVNTTVDRAGNNDLVCAGASSLGCRDFRATIGFRQGQCSSPGIETPDIAESQPTSY